MPRPDPVTIEVIRNRFVSIAETMNNNLARAAYNPVIYEMKDCSVAIFDVDSRLLGQAPGLPIFVGGLEAAIKCTLDHIGGPEMLVPGDVFAVNDSELVGSHLNDVTVLAPIFDEIELIGFAVTKAHWRDIGAKSPGHAMDTTDIFQEGYRLAPTRVLKGGETDQAILDLLTRNSRLPRGVWGDLHAQIAACRTGARELVELHRRFGGEGVRAAADAIFEQAERADREEVASIPDGSWVVSGSLDSWGPGGDPVPVKVRVVVDGDEMTIDLRGSSPQTSGSVNCGRVQTVAAAKLAFKFLINATTAVSDGSFRNLTVLTDEGSVFDAHAPAACQYYYPHLGLMIDLVITALAGPCPQRVVAGEPADAMNILLTGALPSNDEPYVCGEATAIGTGAHLLGDGTNGTANYGAGDLKNLPVEVIEARYPLRINFYRLRPNSGGAGKWRGGLGVERQYQTLGQVTKLSLWWERTQTPGWGLFGGKSGAAGVVVVEIGTKTAQMLKVNGLTLPKGSRVTLKTGGGGGFGPASERDPSAVIDDIADGYTIEG